MRQISGVEGKDRGTIFQHQTACSTIVAKEKPSVVRPMPSFNRNRSFGRNEKFFLVKLCLFSIEIALSAETLLNGLFQTRPITGQCRNEIGTIDDVWRRGSEIN